MADIRRVDLNLLSVLDALLEEHSVTRAAVRLSLTQSTVSGMLNRLRELFADPLFVRTQRGILPTPRAEALARPVKQLLLDAESLISPARFDPARALRTFTVSTTDYMLSSVVIPMIPKLRKLAPRLKIAIRTLPIADLAVQLANGQTDLAVTVPVLASPDLPSRHLYKEDYICLVGRAHPIRSPKPSVDEYCRYDHVLVSPAGGGFKGPVDEALAAVGRKRNVTLSVQSFLILPAILQVTDMIAVVPSRLLLNRSRDLRTFKVPVAVPGFDVIATWHERLHKDPAHFWFRNLLASVTQKKSHTSFRHGNL